MWSVAMWRAVGALVKVVKECLPCGRRWKKEFGVWRGGDAACDVWSK